MSIRTFIFCDICNPRAIRCPEQRRNLKRNSLIGRRLADGRAWFEGDMEIAVREHGWILTAEGSHICPHCHQRRHHQRIDVSTHNHQPDKGRSFIFCDCCNTMGIRYVEQRRHVQRGDQGGRRITDERAWVEGDPQTAVEKRGWIVTCDGNHYCPKCHERHPELSIDAA